MIIERSCPTGGRKIVTFPLEQDPESGKLGYKIGWLKTGEPILLRTIDVEDILKRFPMDRPKLKTLIKQWWITKHN